MLIKLFKSEMLWSNLISVTIGGLLIISVPPIWNLLFHSDDLIVTISRESWELPPNLIDESCNSDLFDKPFGTPSVTTNAFVRNNSKGKMYEVVLVTPDYAYGSIKSHDNSNGTGHSLITGNRVDIGDLHPGEMVEVKMWHKWMFGFEDFRITHKDGVGKIIELRKVNPFWYYLSRNWLIIPWLLTAVSMIPLFGILVPRYFFSTGRIKE